jgi:putative oxidoreductase
MKQFFLKPTLSSPNADWGLLILRVGVSLLMLTHGYGKLQNFLNGATDFPDPLHIGPVVSMGLVVFSEFICSILLILGLFTRLALIPLIITMLVIVFNIHIADPLDVKEHALLFLFPYISLFLTGAGSFSLDACWLK